MKLVLSVQSHVVHGYVGGRAATFPLQCLGWDVDNINTVDFSNHTGYGQVKGTSLSEPELNDLFAGLVSIGCRYDALILGYMRSAEVVEALAANVKEMKLQNPLLLFVCDTVMGDNGVFYVDESCVAAYKSLLGLHIVDVITPNQFELELLYGAPIDSPQTLRTALDFIHNTYGVKHVVVSSLAAAVAPCAGAPNSIYCVVSSGAQCDLSVFRIPEIKSHFTGVGDVFTALLLDKYYACQDDMPRAVNQVLTIMSKVLHLTHQLGVAAFCEANGFAVEDYSEGKFKGTMNDGATMKYFELRIIQARDFYDYCGPGEIEVHLAGNEANP